MSSLFSAGLQGLLDGQQTFIQSGLSAFLRVQNFAPVGDYQEFGVTFTPTGGQSLGNSGFTDLEIIPPPEVRDVSLHNIGMSGGKLRFGARYFLVSNTFVQNILDTYANIPVPEDVWKNWDAVYVNGNPTQQTASVVGIVYDNKLHDIMDVQTVQLAGETIRWKLTCNRHEDSPLEGSSEEVLQP